MNFEQPYPSRRSPVCADNLVATSQPLATQAGIAAMRAGGNAVDAALAAAIALTVVEPNNNGVGSDAFAMVWDGASLHGLNASGRAPAAWTPERFAGQDQMPLLGWDAVTVPGAVSAWEALSRRFGCLPFADLFADAVRLAEDGYLVGPETAFFWGAAAKTLGAQPGFAEHFLPAPGPGARFRRPELAATLRTIAEQGADSFYRGPLAERIAAAAAAGGGALGADDLAAHQADWVLPVAQPYRDAVLHEIPPNGQGLAAQIALGILRHLPPEPLDSERAAHHQIEAMKIAIRAAFDHFADPRAMTVTPEALLEPGALAACAAEIGDRASALPPKALPLSHDTVYLCTADRSGMMVSYIQSNYLGFGSGVVVPNTGIALQNRGAGFSLEAGHPNQVGPGKRPFHTIIPGFVSNADGALMAFGVMGGHMQHQGHVQMVHRVVDHDQNPQAASDAPRWLVEPDFSVSLEQGFNPKVGSGLAARGHQVRSTSQYWKFGGAQLIVKTDQGYVGGSDHRKEGHAAGY